MDDRVKNIAEKLGKLSLGQRANLLREIVQNMNERADSSQDMREIAAFVLEQLDGDADEVVEAHSFITKELP